MLIQKISLNGSDFIADVSIPKEIIRDTLALPPLDHPINVIMNIVYDTEAKKQIIIEKMKEIAHTRLNGISSYAYVTLKGISSYVDDSNDEKFLMTYKLQTTTQTYLYFLRVFCGISQSAIEQHIADLNGSAKNK